MLYSIVTSVVVFLLTLAVSYFVTRPIGDNRRHIAAAFVSLACGVIGGFLEANMGVSVFAALGGAFVGMMDLSPAHHSSRTDRAPKRMSSSCHASGH